MFDLEYVLTLQCHLLSFILLLKNIIFKSFTLETFLDIRLLVLIQARYMRLVPQGSVVWEVTAIGGQNVLIGL